MCSVRVIPAWRFRCSFFFLGKCITMSLGSWLLTIKKRNERGFRGEFREISTGSSNHVDASCPRLLALFFCYYKDNFERIFHYASRVGRCDTCPLVSIIQT